MRCPKCGSELGIGMKYCIYCGFKIMRSNAPPYRGNHNSESPGKGTAIASLILGILSLIFCITGIGAILGFILGVIGVICASCSNRMGYTGDIQTGGLACSIIGTSVSLIVVLVCMICIGTSIAYDL